MGCELCLIGATQGLHNWWTEDLGREQKGTEELGWSLDSSEECGSGKEKNNTNPSQPDADSKTSRTGRTHLKPAEGIYFFFLIPPAFLSFFLFYSFFLPSFIFYLIF